MYAISTHRRRGHALLLAHCSTVSKPYGASPGAFERLEEQLGGDLARRLVSALAAPAANAGRVVV